MKKVFVIECDREDVLSEVSEQSLSVYLHARRVKGTFKVRQIKRYSEIYELNSKELDGI